MDFTRQFNVKSLMRRQRKMHNRRMEIERLKAEYARIKELNEHIIENKMRQVRLNRLFKEIEEIREMSAHRARLRPHNPQRPKTEEEIRIENIKRSRELGREYSKLNALMHYNDFIEDFKAQELADASNHKHYLLEKRLTYGNTVSKTNEAKARSLKMDKKQWNVRKPETSRLQNRLSYGNTHSYINVLLGLKQKNRNILAELLKEELTTSDEPSDLKKEVKEKKKSGRKVSTINEELCKHQDLLDEIRQIQKEKHLKNPKRKRRQKIEQKESTQKHSELSDAGDAGSRSELDQHEKDLEKALASDNEKPREGIPPSKPIKSKVDSDDEKPISASSSVDELIATPRFIQESLMSKKQELAAQGVPPSAFTRPTKASKSSGDLDAFLKYANNLKKSEENVPVESSEEGDSPLKHSKFSKFFGGTNLPYEVQQIKNLFRSVLSQEKLQQVANEFVPSIRIAVDKEVALDKELEAAMEHQSQPQNNDISNQYMF